MKSVSVVIPAYNASATIADAVASVRAQTVRPLEIIIVDDCSKDDTVQRVEALAGPDLILIRSPQNGGGGAARNRGIDAARGDFVAFLDSDDLWVPHKLAKQLAALEQETGNAFSFSALLHTNEYGEQRVLPRRPPGAGESIADYMLKAGHVVQTSTLMVPRGMLGQCRFNERLRRFQDVDFVLRLATAGMSAAYVNEPIVEWRNVGGAPRVSSLKDPAVMQNFMSYHAAKLTPAQKLGFQIRSMGPAPGPIGAIQWLSMLVLSVCAGALAVPNAVSLLLKHSLGTRSYGMLRSRLGLK